MGTGRSFPPRAIGKEEIRQLAQATMAALHDAELTEEIALLESRVFTRPADELFETEVDEQSQRWRFKPMLELLLHHIQQIAAEDTRSADARRREIHWALDAAGF